MIKYMEKNQSYTDRKGKSHNFKWYDGGKKDIWRSLME